MPAVQALVAQEADISTAIHVISFANGQICITSALLNSTDDDSVIAVAIAHEGAHYASHHTMRFSNANLALPKEERLGFKTVEEALLLQEFNFKVSSKLWPEKMSIEKEADLRAIEWAFAAGYDPSAFADFLSRYAAGLGPEDVTHRGRVEERVKEIEENIKGLRPRK